MIFRYFLSLKKSLTSSLTFSIDSLLQDFRTVAPDITDEYGIPFFSKNYLEPFPFVSFFKLSDIFCVPKLFLRELILLLQTTPQLRNVFNRWDFFTFTVTVTQINFIVTIVTIFLSHKKVSPLLIKPDKIIE